MAPSETTILLSGGQIIMLFILNIGGVIGRALRRPS